MWIIAPPSLEVHFVLNFPKREQDIVLKIQPVNLCTAA